MLGLLASVAQAGTNEPAVAVTVLENTPDHVVLDYSFGHYRSSLVTINGKQYQELLLEGEPVMLEAGAPALPRVCRSVIIPGDAEMTLRVLAEEYDEIPAMIAPSKGNLPRSVNPADVPYELGAVYEVDAFYPGPLAVLQAPYIMRDHRGIVVTVNPFQYNPVSRTLRVYTQVTVEVAVVGPGKVNVLKRGGHEKALSQAFHEIYEAHFVNYDQGQRYDPLDEEGDMLIIAYDAWISNVQPLVDHKNSIGIDTTVVGVSTIGNNAAAIKAHIEGVYQTSDLAFVLLVGDAAQVATPTAVSGYNGAADPKYAQLAGDDDYPEIIVGRFSAESLGDVDTQVERTIEYEALYATEEDWFWRGTGIASAEGTGDDGEYDSEHIDNICDDLLNYGYTEVDQIYDPGASSSQVTAAVNAGRGIMNYCGHGGPTSWSTTGFSNGNVNALTNDNMLPFIVSVACNNGQFDDYTCFGEAWLRATNGSEPSGAIACYASSISQPWSPPMEGQDEFNLLYVAEAYHSYGALCYAGSCSMMDDYPGSGESWGTGPATFNTWIIFGDPSLRVVGTVGPPHGMRLSGDDLAAVGEPGGPFVPDSTVYQLENKGETPLDYEVTATVTWVDITNASGTLPGLGSVEVTVSLNAEANALADGLYEGTLYFTNLTDHDGDAERPVSVTVDDFVPRYTFPLDSDPGWAVEGQWAFGLPTGGGSHDGDPSSGRGGPNVYGYNLNGDYGYNMPAYYLTTTAIDCSNLSYVELRFWRWLGVESCNFDHAAVEISNGGSWTELWANPLTSISDKSWSQIVFDITAVAAGEPTIYIRWKMGPTDSSENYPGWNIDDIEIWGVSGGQPIPGDVDGDGDVDIEDLAALLAVYGLCSGEPGFDPAADFDESGCIDLADLSTLLGNYGTGT